MERWVGRWERRVKPLRGSFAAPRPFGRPAAPNGSEGNHGRKRASGHDKAEYPQAEQAVSHMCMNRDSRDFFGPVSKETAVTARRREG